MNMILGIILLTATVIMCVQSQCVNKIGDSLCAASGRAMCNNNKDFQRACPKYCGLTCPSGGSSTNQGSASTNQGSSSSTSTAARGPCINKIGDMLCKMSKNTPCTDLLFQRDCAKHCSMTCGTNGLPLGTTTNTNTNTGGTRPNNNGFPAPSQDLPSINSGTRGPCINKIGDMLCKMSKNTPCTDLVFQRDCAKHCSMTCGADGLPIPKNTNTNTNTGGSTKPGNTGYPAPSQDIVSSGPCRNNPAMGSLCAATPTKYCSSNREFAINCPVRCNLCGKTVK